jgi:hypothetical protein
MWMTYGCSLPKQKRSGLSLASGSLLAVITLLAVFMALLCLTGLYGIFLSTTDRESYNTLFSYFKLVGILFVLLFLGVLFLNQLRHVLRTSHGVLRGNRGMAECPLRIGVCSILFGFLSLYLAFAIEKRAVALALIEHALNRLPSGLATLAQPLAEADWVWLGPSFIGGAVALIATGVVLIMYWQVLRLARSEILRKGGQGKKKVDVKAYTEAQEKPEELPEETPEEVR